MDLTFSYFIQEVFSNPAMLVTVALTLGVIFVNGWTDAPNAIATCIGTRSMRVRPAILTSALFNFLGVLIMTQINSSVASTISNMVDFGDNTQDAMIGLCAALFSIVVYSAAAAQFQRHKMDADNHYAAILHLCAFKVIQPFNIKPFTYATVGPEPCHAGFYQRHAE